MHNQGANPKGQSVGVVGRKLRDRERTGRRDKSSDTTRATIESTRYFRTIEMVLGPVGREGTTGKSSFSNQQNMSIQNVRENIMNC